MTIARKHLIDYERTCFYHCMSRCVRQGYLLNSKHVSSLRSSYRNDWIEDRLLLLADVFAIDVYAFAIMDNHTHSLFHVNLPLARQWSDTEVLRRWSKIGGLPLLCQIYLSREWRVRLNDVELCIVKEKVNEIRKKLTCLSTFMSYFNSYIAKRANKEDGVTGHFWEARFKSEAMMDADAFLACMAYIDLNPMRAGKSKSLIKSSNTSIKKRLLASHNAKSTLIAPLRSEFVKTKISTLNDLNLEKYSNYLNSIFTKKTNDSRIKAIKAFSEGENNWLQVSGDSRESRCVNLGTCDDIPLPYLNKCLPTSQATEQRALADAILDRLLDERYPCGNEHRAN